MGKNVALSILTLALAVAFCPAARADSITSENQLDAYLPRHEALDQLKKKILADPANKDNYIAYARLAGVLGKSEEVVWAYERLLTTDPTLDRVRLDLSLVYIAQSRFDDARALLDSVMEKNPPETVKQNIRAVLAKIDEAQKKNHLSASFTLGIGGDTNANAAPNSILVFDNAVPLTGDELPKGDFLAFAALTLGDTYDIGNIYKDVLLRWKTSALTYQTQQKELNDLDLQLYGARTGPEFIYTPLDLHVNLDVGYNYLLLHTESYLRDPSAEITVEMPVYKDVRLWAGSMMEYREFLNSNTITTFDDRSGQARQAQTGVRYSFSDRSLWELTGTLRHEDAKQSYYADNQYGIALSNTYGFSPDFAGGWLHDVFTVARVGYTEAVYDTAETLISDKVREDDITSYQFTLGKKITPDIIVSGSYAFTDEVSNVKNYRYIDQRYLLSVTKNF